MITKQKPKGLKVEVGYTKLYVPHLDGGEIIFTAPYKGPGMYANLASQLDKDNLDGPTFSQNSSLIYSAWETHKENPEEEFSKKIIAQLKSNCLACFTGVHYVHNEGAYIQDAPEIKDDRVFMEKSELVKKLEANDHSVRFVPFGYKIEYQSPSELEKNPFVRALAGEEGAQKLAEVSGNYRDHPYVFSFVNVSEPITKQSALSVSLAIDGEGGLYVHGDIRSFSSFGFSLVVFPKICGGVSRNFPK